MIVKFTKLAATALFLSTVVLGGMTAAQAQNMAHVHMGHVSEAWNDTPDGMGLLPTAIAEAEIAVIHANLAAQQLDNLDWMKTHSLHVLHAIDASAIDAGPGLGYGVTKAASGVVKHIGFATEAEEATENVTLHAVHITSSANNTLARIAELVGNINAIQAASSASAAAPAVEQLLRHAIQLLDGRDANGDGSVSWNEDEGGLRNTEKHMGFMRDGENL
ncbi:MAG: hypothetical protein ACU0DI_09780 [Paracoccaceae bacterium]